MQIRQYLDKHKELEYYRGSMKQVGFIVGTGRCGSTLLAAVLNAHSKICVPHELQIIVSIGNGDRLYDKYHSGEYKHFKADDFINLIAQCCPYNFNKFFDYYSHFNDLPYPQNNLSELLTGLFDHICYKYGKEIFLEQTPWYGRKLNELLEIFPDLKVIHLVRDGRDVAISYTRTPWWSKDISMNLKQWANEIDFIESYKDKLSGRFIEIRYEDLVCSPEEMISQILNQFDVEFQPDMILPENLIDYSKMFINKELDFTSKAQKNWDENKNKVFFKESLYSWKKYEGFNFSDISSKVTYTLLKYGYKK